MHCVLLLEAQTLRLLQFPGEPGIYSFIEFDSPTGVYVRLKRCQYDAWSISAMRQALRMAGAYDVMRLSDDQVVREVATLVQARRITVADRILVPELPHTTLEETEEPAPAEEAPAPARTPAPAPAAAPAESDTPVDQDAQAEALTTASENGTPFCEECEKARLAALAKDQEREEEQEEVPV